MKKWWIIGIILISILILLYSWSRTHISNFGEDCHFRCFTVENESLLYEKLSERNCEKDEDCYLTYFVCDKTSLKCVRDNRSKEEIPYEQRIRAIYKRTDFGKEECEAIEANWVKFCAA